jgi:hypothetical protein
MALMRLNDFIQAFRALDPVLEGKCFYCGVQTNKRCKPHHAVYQTKDHVIPASVKNWEQFVESRCVRCCRRCNSIKEDLTLFEFKRRAKIEEFFAETHLGVRIESLEDIHDVTNFVMANRRIEGRCVKFDGKPEHRTSPVTVQELASN